MGAEITDPPLLRLLYSRVRGGGRSVWSQQPNKTNMVAISPAQVAGSTSSRSSTPRSDTESNCASASSIEEGPCQCRWSDCGLWVSEVKTLGKHIERDHCKQQGDGLFYCRWESCKRSMRGFNARYKMTVHMRTHTKEKPYTCQKCEKKFSRAENLKIHARSHTGEKPYVCLKPGCGKRYSNSSDRFKHTRTHTIDKPYPCKVEGCQKRYTDPSSLRKHVKTYKHFLPGKMSTPVTPRLPHTPTINMGNNYKDRMTSPNTDERGWWNHEERQQPDNCQERINAFHFQALRRNLHEYERAFLMRTSMEYYPWRRHMVPWQQPQEQPLDLSKPIYGHQ